MPDRLYVNEEQGIIEVESYGEITRDDIEDSLAQCRQIHATRGLFKIIVDTTRQESLPGTVTMFDLFSRIPRAFRMAMVVSGSQLTQRDVGFIETVCHNRGIRMRIFSSRDDALAWLHRVA